MTITSTVARNDYTGSGGTGPYAFTFKVFAYSQLIAYVTDLSGNITTLNYLTGFTATGANNAAGGTITFNTAITSGYAISIQRSVLLTQLYDFRNQANFFPATYEDAQDYGRMVDQELSAMLGHCFQLPAASAISPIIGVLTAGDYLRVNLAGTGIEAVTTVVAAQNFLQSGTGAVVRSANAKMGEVLSVTDFGADITGTLDATPAVNAAYAFAATAIHSAATVVFPPGIYKLNSVPIIAANIGTVIQAGVSFPGPQTLTTTGTQSVLDLRAGMVKLRASAPGNVDTIALGTGALGAYTTSSSSGSVAIGRGALAAATTGDNNTALGTQALTAVVVGGNNTAVGNFALANNTAANNTAVGSYALNTNSSGTSNTAIGEAALYLCSTGGANTAVGWACASSLSTAINTTAVGSGAMTEWTGGDSNVAIGSESLFGNVHGDQVIDGGMSAGLPGWSLAGAWSDGGGYANHAADGTGLLSPSPDTITYGAGATYQIVYTVVHYASGQVICSFGGVGDTPRNANGTYTFTCVPILWPSGGSGGAGSLNFQCSNTARLGITDVSLVCTDATSGGSNVAIGSGAGYMTTSGTDNTMIGVGAMGHITTGGHNVAVGAEVMYSAGTSAQNVAVGFRALYSNLSGAGCVVVGYGAGYYETGSNALYIDNATRASLSDGKAKALVYGVFASTVAAQRLTFNASVGIAGPATATSTLNVSGLPTSASGLATGDVWNNSGVLTIH